MQVARWRGRRNRVVLPRSRRFELESQHLRDPVRLAEQLYELGAGDEAAYIGLVCYAACRGARVQGVMAPFTRCC